MAQTDDLEARLDALTTVILPPLRTYKRLDLKALTALNEMVDDLVTRLGDDPVIPRRLTGKLWFVFTQMLDQADHTRSPGEILDAAWNYQEHLERLFGPLYDQDGS